MDFGTLLILAMALSMDAFAMAVCKGMARKKIMAKTCLIVGLWFGGFQGIMPFVGFLLGIRFAGIIAPVSTWIAFILLVTIGINMLHESMEKDNELENDSLNFKEMLVLSVAASVDALTVGITFACMPLRLIHGADGIVNTAAGCMIIAVTTCILSMLGVKVGSIFGMKYKNKAELAGGIILVLIGVKILLEVFA